MNAFATLEAEEATPFESEKISGGARQTGGTHQQDFQNPWSANKETLANLARPHWSSYFLPGKGDEPTMLYLVDTCCNTNLVGMRVFDRLPKHIQDQRMECNTHGQMALDFHSME